MNFNFSRDKCSNPQKLSGLYAEGRKRERERERNDRRRKKSRKKKAVIHLRDFYSHKTVACSFCGIVYNNDDR